MRGTGVLPQCSALSPYQRDSGHVKPLAVPQVLHALLIYTVGQAYPRTPEVTNASLRIACLFLANPLSLSAIG